jgi:hypothetical protein
MSIAEEGIALDSLDAKGDPNKRIAKPARLAVPAPLSAMDLEELLAQSVAERAGGRIRMLNVEIRGGRVVLSGFASSYHAVQLALAGLQEAYRFLRLDRPERVELDFDLPPSGP